MVEAMSDTRIKILAAVQGTTSNSFIVAIGRMFFGVPSRDDGRLFEFPPVTRRSLNNVGYFDLLKGSHYLTFFVREKETKLYGAKLISGDAKFIVGQF